MRDQLDARSPGLRVPTTYFAIALVAALAAILASQQGGYWLIIAVVAFPIGVIGVVAWVVLGWLRALRQAPSRDHKAPGKDTPGS